MACQLCTTEQLQAWPKQAASITQRVDSTEGPVLLSEAPTSPSPSNPLHIQPRPDKGVL